MMGQLQIMDSVATLRRTMLVVLVTALMALVMAASATSAFAAPNHGDAANGSAAGQCGQAPGQSINNADHPTIEPFGEAVKHKCAPGQQT
jgi:hypothetical protein